MYEHLSLDSKIKFCEYKIAQILRDNHISSPNQLVYWQTEMTRCIKQAIQIHQSG